MADLKRVILLVESSRAYGRGCLLGIASYVRTHDGWEIMLVERALTERIPAIAGQWCANGVISRMENRLVFDAVSNLRLPTVDLCGSYCTDGGATLTTDPAACADLAVAHFRERGFRHFGFCGYTGIEWSDLRWDAFSSKLEGLGLALSTFAPPARPRKSLTTRSRESIGETEEPHIGSWLESLPKPVAIFACNDVRGRQVLAACRQVTLNVPDEVAVIGVDDDEILCELSQPPLSSIDPDAHGVGMRGAEILDHLMDGQAPPKGRVLVPPRLVATRQSTSTIAEDDAKVAAAMGFIRDRACRGIHVDDVVATVDISRATLERRFRNAIGRSPAEEIERVKMKRVKMLLTETDYKLRKIAPLAGFNSSSQLATTFKRVTGQTPGEFRSSDP